jgi:hypothetical protein
MGIVVRCDGGSNFRDDNLRQSEKANIPRVETEEGTMKVFKLEHSSNAEPSIVRIAAGDSKVTWVN